MSVREIYDLTKIDPWFLHQIKDLVEFSEELATFGKLLDQGRGQDQVAGDDSAGPRKMASPTSNWPISGAAPKRPGGNAAGAGH